MRQSKAKVHPSAKKRVRIHTFRPNRSVMCPRTRWRENSNNGLRKAWPVPTLLALLNLGPTNQPIRIKILKQRLVN